MINGFDEKNSVYSKIFGLNNLHLSHLVEVDQQKHSHRTFCGIVSTYQKSALREMSKQQKHWTNKQNR